MHGWMESKNDGNSSRTNLILLASQHHIKCGVWNVWGFIVGIDCLYLEGRGSPRMRLWDMCVKKNKRWWSHKHPFSFGILKSTLSKRNQRIWIWATFKWSWLRLHNSVFSAALGMAGPAGRPSSLFSWHKIRTETLGYLTGRCPPWTDWPLCFPNRPLNNSLKLSTTSTNRWSSRADGFHSFLLWTRQKCVWSSLFNSLAGTILQNSGPKEGKVLAFKHKWGKRFKSLFSHCSWFLPLYAAITMFPMGVCAWTLEPRNLCPLWPPLPIHAVAHWRQTVMDSHSDSVESVFSKQHRLWGLRWRPEWWSLLPPGEWRDGTTITPGLGTPLGVRWKRNLTANTWEGAAVMTEAVM